MRGPEATHRVYAVHMASLAVQHERGSVGWLSSRCTKHTLPRQPPLQWRTACAHPSLHAVWLWAALTCCAAASRPTAAAACWRAARRGSTAASCLARCPCEAETCAPRPAAAPSQDQASTPAVIRVSRSDGRSADEGGAPANLHANAAWVNPKGSLPQPTHMLARIIQRLCCCASRLLRRQLANHITTANTHAAPLAAAHTMHTRAAKFRRTSSSSSAAASAASCAASASERRCCAVTGPGEPPSSCAYTCKDGADADADGTSQRG